jgi:hypothetical protein
MILETYNTCTYLNIIHQLRLIVFNLHDLGLKSMFCLHFTHACGARLTLLDLAAMINDITSVIS